MVKATAEPDKFFTLSRIIFYVFSIIVFYLAVHYISKLKDIEQLLMQMEPGWLFLAISAQVLTYLIYALMLKLLIKDKPGIIDFFLLFKLSVAIMFVNQILPTGGISGDGYIFNQFIKRKVSRYNAFTTMVLESISYYAAILILLLIFYTWYLNLATHDTILITYTVILGFVFYILLLFLLLDIGIPRMRQYHPTYRTFHRDRIHHVRNGRKASSQKGSKQATTRGQGTLGSLHHLLFQHHVSKDPRPRRH